MGINTQANRPIALTTPLGPDALLLTGFAGHEGISQLFSFEVELIAGNRTAIDFDKLMGQSATVRLELPGRKQRFFNGVISRFRQGRRDETFTTYRAEIVPQFWLWTRRVQSRVFQHLTVPAILKIVLEGLDVAYEIQGPFHPRDYCVQYRESDFAFASRLMEEEGIYYFFKHSADGHKMVVANTPLSHPDLPHQSKVLFEEITGGNRPEDRVFQWEKLQELRSGKVTLWDHCFELPHKNLEGRKIIQDSVAVGTVTHKLKVAGNDRLEIYDNLGAYAQRFDGLDAAGGDRSGDLAKIYDDRERTVAIRMQQEALKSIEILGAGSCRQFVSGHKFRLERHFNGDGPYVLTTVGHAARLGADYRSGHNGQADFTYDNTFTCIPIGLPFRPPLVTPKPTIAGTQTAVVVGPPGEKIYPDKYGRVKVKFHWDRAPERDQKASCWVRVSQNWGGANWGGMFIPHVGQEVIVQYEEGDPDRPVITGRVYNAECMPPLKLPDHKTKCMLQDHGGNKICMEGHDGKQRITISSPTGKTVFRIGAPP